MKLTGNWSFPAHLSDLVLAESPKSAMPAQAARHQEAASRHRPGPRGRWKSPARALDLIQDAGLERALFAAVDPNPSERNLEDGLRLYRNGGFDGVVAFGGGSGLDLGKTLAFMAGQSRPVWDFEDVGDWWTRADPSGIHPIVAVPTTAGTGSEVGRARRHHQLGTPMRRRSSFTRRCCLPRSYAIRNSRSVCRRPSRPAPGLTPSRIASKRSQARITTRSAKALRSKACDW